MTTARIMYSRLVGLIITVLRWNANSTLSDLAQHIDTETSGSQRYKHRKKPEFDPAGSSPEPNRKHNANGTQRLHSKSEGPRSLVILSFAHECPLGKI